MTKKLSRRQEIEKNYHNKKYEHEYRVINKHGSIPYGYFYDVIGDVNGLKVLDFGCGDGWYSCQMAQRGAEVVGIDISEELIRKANQQMKKRNLKNNLNFQVMAGEDLQFFPENFDLVVGSAILHHTDIDLAIKSIHRVLKKRGRCVFIEPMNQNFLLKVWRFLTPWRRSPVEKALLWRDINLINSFFPKTEIKFFHLFAMITSGLMIFQPNLKIVEVTHKKLTNFDNCILNRWPVLGRYCAVVVLNMKKT